VDLEQTTSRRESGHERRAAIAMAAREVIVEKGLEGLRTRDIAQRVGINVATLHYHVPSKEALVALVAESIRHVFRNQYARRSRAGKTALELLRMEFEDFSETMLDTPELIIVMAELTERARRDPAVLAVMEPLTRFWRDQMAEILRLGMADGSFRTDIDPDAGALIVTGALSQFARKGGEAKETLALFAELERAFVRLPRQ
jgi:AcrR family transcriptional regulator